MSEESSKKRLINKFDIILFILLIILGACAFLIIKFTRAEGKTVNIYSDGELTESFSLDDDTEYVYIWEDGNNVIVIENGYVYVSHTDCPDKICVNQGEIKNDGETIVCIPHRLVIEVDE